MINQTFAELRTSGKLPSPSGVGMQILRLTQGDDFSTDEIGQAISADSALTGRLLKLANSAESGALEPITTIGEATIRLGIRTVRNVALGLSLVATSRSGACASFDYDKYWSLSLARAVAGQQLSRVLRRGVPAEMYILGLLADVGSLALASSHPEYFSEIIDDKSLHTSDERCKAELSRFEIHHRDIASFMLLDWGLPQDFAKAAKTYETCSFAQLDRKIDSLAELLRAADLIAQLCIADEDTTASEWQQLALQFAELERVSGFVPEEFQRTCNSAAAEWREWGQVLGIPTLRQVDFTKLDEIVAEALEKGAPPEEVSPRASKRAALIANSIHDETALHILAVANDTAALQSLARHLQSGGHRVATAASGDEALKLALQDCPQLVIADGQMSGIDGIELCAALRKIDSGQKIYFLLLSDISDEESVVQAFGKGVDDFITKPFNPRILLARINAGRRIIYLQSQVEQEKRKQHKQMMDLQVLTRKLRSAALTDPLTELPNRRYAMKRLAQAWESSSRTSKPVSVIMMDIDHFKAVNDNFGHDAGDAVLRGVAKTLMTSCREEEDVCRIGGEEFVVICANTTSAQAEMAAERLRVAVESAPVTWQGVEHSVTMSFGVATRTPSTTDYEMVLKAADEAVYMAKSSGRNCVKVAKDNPIDLKKSA